MSHSEDTKSKIHCMGVSFKKKGSGRLYNVLVGNCKDVLSASKQAGAYVLEREGSAYREYGVSVVTMKEGDTIKGYQAGINVTR